MRHSPMQQNTMQNYVMHIEMVSPWFIKSSFAYSSHNKEETVLSIPSW